MGSMQWERQPSMQREDQTDHGNGLGTNSSESAVNHLSKSVVRDTEGAAKQKPHATFCGNRGRATAPSDPVGDIVMCPCYPAKSSSRLPAGSIISGALWISTASCSTFWSRAGA